MPLFETDYNFLKSNLTSAHGI